MITIARRDLLKIDSAAIAGAAALDVTRAEKGEPAPSEMPLKDSWFIQSSVPVDKGGEVLSRKGFVPEKWHGTSVPCTVLSALAKTGAHELSIANRTARISVER